MNFGRFAQNGHKLLLPLISPRGCVRHLTKGKGNSERAHKHVSNGMFPHVASPLNGRVVSHPIWGMLPFCPICVSLSPQWEK